MGFKTNYEILCCRPCLRGLRLCQGSLYWTSSGCWLWLSLCLWLHCRCSRSCCGCCPCCCRCCPCGLRSPARGLRRSSLRWSFGINAEYFFFFFFFFFGTHFCIYSRWKLSPVYCFVNFRS